MHEENMQNSTRKSTSQDLNQGLFRSEETATAHCSCLFVKLQVADLLIQLCCDWLHLLGSGALVGLLTILFNQWLKVGFLSCYSSSPGSCFSLLRTCHFARPLNCAFFEAIWFLQSLVSIRLILVVVYFHPFIGHMLYMCLL